MPDFVVKSRVTSPIEENTVTANSRELAVTQVVTAAAPGAQVEILDVTEAPAASSPPAGL